MKLNIKTWEQLSSEGFHRDYPRCYKGLKKAPDATFPEHFILNILGREAQVLELDDFEHGKIRVMVGRQAVVLGTWIFVESIDLHKILKPVEKRFPDISSNPIKYVKNYGFTFPCAFQEMPINEARKVAQWILQVTE